MMQLDEARKQLDARQKTRAREGSRLRNALTNLEAQAAADAQQVVSAQQAHEELLKNLPSYLSPTSQARPPPPSLAPKSHVGRPAPAGAVQAPALAALAPSHWPPSLSARPHLKRSFPKLTPSQCVVPQDMAPHLQGVSTAAVKAALPMSMAPKAGSAREMQPMQQAACHPTLLQRASTSTAQTRHAYTALEQSAQHISLPQGRYSPQWLAAASARAQALTLQQRVAAARESPQPLLKRPKLSSPSERAGWLSGSAAAVTARNAPVTKRAEATADSNKHTLLPAGPETLREGLMSELTGSKTQQGGFTTQQTGSMTQQPPSLPLPWTRTATAMHPPQNLATYSATLSTQAARLHPTATVTSCTAQPRLVLPPAAAWTGTPVPVAQLRQASPARHKAPVLSLQSQQCQPQAVPNSMMLASPCHPASALAAAGAASALAALLTPAAGSLSTQSAAHPSAPASAALVTAASVPAASCLASPGTSSLQVIATQQQLVSEMLTQATSGQAITRQEVSHQVKVPAQTCHLQAPTCSMAAASASASASGTTPVSAAHGLSSTVHLDVYSPGCQMLPSQHVIAQGMVAQPSAAQRVVAVSSVGGTASAQASRVQSCVAQGSEAHGPCPQPPASQILTSSRAHACQPMPSSCTSNRAATPNSLKSHTDTIPTACILPQLLAPVSLGLPAELLALFNQPEACTPHASSSLLSCCGPSYAAPNMQLPKQSASWQTRGSKKSIMPNHTSCDDVHSQQHANIMLGGMY